MFASLIYKILKANSGMLHRDRHTMKVFNEINHVK